MKIDYTKQAREALVSAPPAIQKALLKQVKFLAFLFQGTSCRPYNVGSAEEITIAGLARTVADNLRPEAVIEIARQSVPGAPAARYVPSVDRAEKELGLKPWIPLAEGIRRSQGIG